MPATLAVTQEYSDYVHLTDFFRDLKLMPHSFKKKCCEQVDGNAL
jgi:hypothetical protein